MNWRRNMRRIALPALGFALLLSGAPLFSQMNATVEKALESNEKTGWQAWKDHNAKPVEAWTPDNAIGVAEGGYSRGRSRF
jgi:hypothetical protein